MHEYKSDSHYLYNIQNQVYIPLCKFKRLIPEYTQIDDGFSDLHNGIFD